jgi:hypothetical protein
MNEVKHMGWQQVGYIGADDTPYLQGAQQEVGAQQELGKVAPQKMYSPRAVSKTSPKVPVPSGLAQLLQSAPTEVFDIYPGYPNVAVSSLLAANLANVESVVHTFTPPTGHYVVINPADITQEVLFEPYASSDGTVFILGLINIYTRTGLLGFQQRLYSGGSEFHNPARNVSSVGNRRRWQFGAIISPGDTIDTRFFAPAPMFNPLAAGIPSHLDHRVSIKKVTP